jgi:hypothetical protein
VAFSTDRAERFACLPERYHAEIHAFVLMDNHYRLLLRGHLPVPRTADRRIAVGALSWLGQSQAAKLLYWSGV